MVAVAVAGPVLLAGCFALGSAPVEDPGVVQMGCEQSETFLFSGRTSLAAIGLEEFVGGPDAQRVGMVWVTAERVDAWGPGGPPPGQQPDLQQLVCVQWPDGSGMSGPVPAGWKPPSAVALDAPAGDGPPWVLIGLVVAALVLGGVSYLAFRGERPTS